MMMPVAFFAVTDVACGVISSPLPKGRLRAQAMARQGKFGFFAYPPFALPH
jgi:hypothetical protein